MAPPCVMVVFGATGDLSTGKLLPALARLAARGELADAFTLVGVARTPLTDEEFRSLARKVVAGHFRHDDDESVWGELTEHFRYVTGSYESDETFARLDRVLEELDRCLGTRGSRLHYLAVPPLVVPTVVAALGRHGLNRPPPDHRDAFVRIVIEKPFGHDRASAEELDELVHRVFEESQVYRIDHYLGKESVQNVLALRFANAIFEPIWNRKYVDAVEITVAEAVGVGLTGLLPISGGLGLLAASTLVAALLSETTSNTASANMVVPVVIAIARASGADPFEPALGATMGASLGFMLPVSTPCNAIVYGSGMIPLGRMIRYGLMLEATYAF